MKSGLIAIYKEPGYTSFDVVAKLRGMLHIKKVGHTGTLDPDATGVLVVCFGKATKLCGRLTDSDKSYLATLKLGETTDTYDSSGNIIDTQRITVSGDDVLDALKQFEGEIEQIPPMYSALKVGGKRLYELAREGKEVERKARKVNIYNIRAVSIEVPFVTLHIDCSKGTYIRSICHDLGQALGCGAHMTGLIRTKAAGFELTQCVKLSEVQELANSNRLDEIFIPIDKVYNSLPKVVANDNVKKILKNGGSIGVGDVKWCDESYNVDICKDNHSLDNDRSISTQVRMYFSDDTFVGIYNIKRDKLVLDTLYLEQ